MGLTVAPIEECVMPDHTKINIDEHWVWPAGLNPATGKCGGRVSLLPPTLTSPAYESRDTRQQYFLHRFLPRLNGKAENLRPICLPFAFFRSDISG
jgi:hypothetical protein